MKLCIASDHRGYTLKENLLKYLKGKYDITDLGTNNTEMVDYTKYGFLVGEKIKNNEYDLGIVICGSGIGISIACNKVKKVRCAKVDNKEDAMLTRKDNNANVIALSGKKDINEAIDIVETFINTEFGNLDRYVKRINDIYKYENGEYIDR